MYSTHGIFTNPQPKFCLKRKVGLLRLANHQGLYNGTLDGENNPHGFGSIRYLKGDRFDRFNYTGQWHQGDIGGGGIMYWNNGARSVLHFLH